jgi:protein-disulfide isomerase
LKIDGTPCFIIGTAVFPGAVSIDELKTQIAAVRKGDA